LLVGIAMLTFVIVLFVARARSGSALSASTGQTGTQTQETQRSASDVAGPAPTTDAQTAPPPVAGDPVEEEARRAVSREGATLGLPPPATVSPDGRVHLRTGGTISADEWNEARRKLKENPLLKDPPVPPPF
jgi:hypothetical protein